MILLNKKEYHKVLKPLQQVEINHLFADAVALGHVNGQIYVDNANEPTSFYIEHPYGMALLLGNSSNEAFNDWLLNQALNTFKTRNRYEWLQAFPKTWNDQIATAWATYLVKQKDNTDDGFNSNKIEENTRVNFRFNQATYFELKSRLLLSDAQVIRTDRQTFENMQGSVIPKRFWNNAEDFCSRAVAFSVMDGESVACTAFSAFVVGNQLEIGIETSDNYRGKGYAIATCAALIDYCLEHGYEPVWGCKLENTASYLLAQKLGFEPTVYWPFYRLNN